MRIPDGARYTFVEVAGTSAWDGEPFYNRRLQMATIGDDRLLVEHRGGDLQIILRERPRLDRLATDSLAAALDQLLISMADRRHGGDVITVLLAAMALPLAVRRVRRRPSERIHVVPAAAIGLIAALGPTKTGDYALLMSQTGPTSGGVEWCGEAGSELLFEALTPLGFTVRVTRESSVKRRG